MQKSVTWDIMSLTVVFTEEDRVVTEFLLWNKGYSARRLVKEFPLKNWKIGGLSKLLKKTDDTDSDIKHFMFTSQVMKLMIIY